jgi:hypothetical protein
MQGSRVGFPYLAREYAMEQLAGMHLARQARADVAYVNIRRRSSTLKIIVPPGTVTETLKKQPDGIVTSENTFKLSTAKVVITVDPPSTCGPKLSDAHPHSTGADDADLSRYPTCPPGTAISASMRSSGSCSRLGTSRRFITTKFICLILSTCSNGQRAGRFLSPPCAQRGGR